MSDETSGVFVGPLGSVRSDGGLVLRRPDGRRMSVSVALLLVFLTLLVVVVTFLEWHPVLAPLMMAIWLVIVYSAIRVWRGRVVLFDDHLLVTGLTTQLVERPDVVNIEQKTATYQGRQSFLVVLGLSRPRGLFRSRRLALPGLEVRDAWSGGRQAWLRSWQDQAVQEIAGRWDVPRVSERTL